MENLKEYRRDPNFEKFVYRIADFVMDEVKDRLKEFKPVEDEKLTYTPKEAAKVLGVGANTIYKLLKENDFPSMMISEKYYISKKGLEEWVQAQINKK